MAVYRFQWQEVCHCDAKEVSVWSCEKVKITDVPTSSKHWLGVFSVVHHIFTKLTVFCSLPVWDKPMRHLHFPVYPHTPAGCFLSLPHSSLLILLFVTMWWTRLLISELSVATRLANGSRLYFWVANTIAWVCFVQEHLNKHTDFVFPVPVVCWVYDYDLWINII